MGQTSPYARVERFYEIKKDSGSCTCLLHALSETCSTSMACEIKSQLDIARCKNSNVFVFGRNTETKLFWPCPRIRDLGPRISACGDYLALWLSIVSTLARLMADRVACGELVMLVISPSLAVDKISWTPLYPIRKDTAAATKTSEYRYLDVFISPSWLRHRLLCPTAVGVCFPPVC